MNEQTNARLVQLKTTRTWIIKGGHEATYFVIESRVRVVCRTMDPAAALLCKKKKREKSWNNEMLLLMLLHSTRNWKSRWEPSIETSRRTYVIIEIRRKGYWKNAAARWFSNTAHTLTFRCCFTVVRSLGILYAVRTFQRCTCATFICVNVIERKNKLLNWNGKVRDVRNQLVE